VICQEGARSLSIAVWLLRNGWTNVLSMQGGMAGFTYMKSLGKGPKQTGSV
jgi:rhodanese-related sulfurtransferase